MRQGNHCSPSKGIPKMKLQASGPSGPQSLQSQIRPWPKKATLDQPLRRCSQATRLLSSGLLTRGAVAKGKLHHDNPVMFGPAFLEAYHIETTIAKYPQVVLSRETYQNFQEQRGAVVANPRIL